MKKKLLVAGITVMGALLFAGCTKEKGLPDLEIELPSMSEAVVTTPAEPEKSEKEDAEPVAGEVYETLEITWAYDGESDEDACTVYIDMAGVEDTLPGDDSTSYKAVDASGNVLYECSAVYGECKITVYKTVIENEDEHVYEIRLEPNHPMDADKYDAELEIIRNAKVNGTPIGDDFMVRGATGIWYGLIEKTAGD